MASNTRELHAQRVTQACILIDRFGYLRSTEIALLMYSGAASSERLARRLMQSLADSNLVLQRRTSLCEPIHYALSEVGARIVREATGESCSSGKDLIREVSKHRDASNTICAQAMAAGLQVITDREIATGSEKEKNLGFGKVPDGLIIDDWTDDFGGLTRDYHWIEVENSKRGGRDLHKVAAWIYRHAFPDHSGRLSDYRDGRIASILFVISNPAARQIKLRVLEKLASFAATGSAQDQRWVSTHAPDLIKTIDITAGERFTPP